MIRIYTYNPGWNVPCISPFVTKTIYYMRMAGIPHEIKRQDLSRLTQDAPYGKLPYIYLAYLCAGLLLFFWQRRKAARE